MTTRRTIGKSVKAEVCREVLKYAVNRDLFCKNCKTSLDIRNAVSISATLGNRSRSMTLCGACWAEGGDVWRWTTPEMSNVEVIEGRKL